MVVLLQRRRMSKERQPLLRPTYAGPSRQMLAADGGHGSASLETDQACTPMSAVLLSRAAACTNQLTPPPPTPPARWQTQGTPRH
jgi:hypothetical protein